MEAAKEGGAPGGDLAALDDKALDSRRPSKRARDDDQDADVAEVPAPPGAVPHPRDARHCDVQFPRTLLSRDSVVMVDVVGTVAVPHRDVLYLNRRDGAIALKLVVGVPVRRGPVTGPAH